MKFFEYRLHYHVVDEVMESTRYTMAEDDSHAKKNFLNIAPRDERHWDYMEMFCPYRDRWMVVKTYNNQSPVTNN